MQRIDTSDERYHDADPLNGVAGTVVKAGPLNSLQEEIIAVITAAGIPLDPAANDQLYQAILAVTGNGQIAWGAITGKPATYPPSAHDQDWSTITGKPDSATRWPAWDEVTGKPVTYPPSAHDQDWSTITGKPDNVTRWPAWSEVTDKPAFGSMALQNAGAVDITGGTVSLSQLGLGAAPALLYSPSGDDCWIRVGTAPNYKYFAFHANGDFGGDGNIGTSGDITAGDSMGAAKFVGTGATVILGGGHGTASNVSLRPNGWDSGVGQTYVEPSGRLRVDGDIVTKDGLVLCAGSLNVKVASVALGAGASYDVQANHGNGLYIIYEPDGGGRFLGLFVTALIPGYKIPFTGDDQHLINLGTGFVNQSPSGHTFDIYRWGG